MMLKTLVLIFVIMSAWSIHQSESFSTFNRKLCRDVPETRTSGLVVGGQVSPRNKWPWMAVFYMKTDDQFFCAGSLISEQFVLTAAHCLHHKGDPEPLELSEVNVYLGKWNLTDKTEPSAVLAAPEKFLIHPDWDVSDTRWNADIAIVKLSENVQLSKSIQPVCLWTSLMQPNKENDGGIVVGWGQMANQKQGEHSEVPRELKLRILPIHICYETDGLRTVTSHRGLCLEGNGNGPCHGDNGSGLFTARGGKWFLRGITSISMVTQNWNCDVTQPSVFTNVEKFVPWIDQILDGEQIQL